MSAVALLAVGAVAGGAWVHTALERPALEAARERIDRYEQDIAAMRGRLDESLNALAALEGRFLVEESTRLGLETSLRTAQDELGRARDTIAFYEELLPPGPSGAVSVRALDVERVGPHLEYRLLVMRSGGSDKPFRGELRFRAEGRMGGEPVTVDLQPVVLPAPGSEAAIGASTSQGRRGEAVPAGAPQRDAGAVQSGSAEQGAKAVPADALAEGGDSGLLGLEFLEFQRSSGVLGLPDGFEPESVTVNVLEGRNLRASRSVEVPARP